MCTRLWKRSGLRLFTVPTHKMNVPRWHHEQDRGTEAQIEPLLSVRKVYYDSEIWKQGYTRNKGECDMPVASVTDLPNRRAVEREWGPLSLGAQDAEGSYMTCEWGRQPLCWFHYSWPNSWCHPRATRSSSFLQETLLTIYMNSRKFVRSYATAIPIIKI